MVGTRFPPHDLAAALPQQIWTLAAAREALAGVTLPAPERSGAMIGVGCDPAVARYGARWRLPEFAAAWGVTDETWVRGAAALVSPPLVGAGVLGTMPNLPANRLNVQFDLAGPGYTIAAEELSGVRALQVALRALHAGELDLALAGAADFSCDPVHEAAARELDLPGPGGDGAVVLALKRLEDARRDGDRVYALIDGVTEAEETGGPACAGDDDFGDAEIAARFGRPHAAFGLVRVLAAITACAAGRRPGGAAWPGERRAQCDIRGFGGQRLRVGVRAAQQDAVDFPTPAAAAEPAATYDAHLPDPVLPPLPVAPAALQPAPVLAPIGQEAAFSIAGREGAAPAATMPTSPSLARVTGDGEVTALLPPPTIAHDGSRAREALAQIADQVAQATRVHRAFLEDQAAAHRQFLEFRERTAAALLAAAIPAGTQELASPGEGPGEGVARRGGLHRRNEVSDRSGGITTMEVRSVRTPQPERETESASARELKSSPILTATGIPFDRHALEIHASGRISEIFGARFADQDNLRRRVRMPEPPLLLADRVVRLEAQPLSLGTGTVVDRDRRRARTPGTCTRAGCPRGSWSRPVRPTCCSSPGSASTPSTAASASTGCSAAS